MSIRETLEPAYAGAPINHELTLAGEYGLLSREQDFEQIDTSVITELGLSHAAEIYTPFQEEVAENLKKIDVEPFGDLPCLIFKPRLDYAFTPETLVSDLNYIRDQFKTIAFLTEVGHGPKIIITPRPADVDDPDGSKAYKNLLLLTRVFSDRYIAGLGVQEDNPDAADQGNRSFLMVQRIPWYGLTDKTKAIDKKDKNYMMIFDRFDWALLAAARAYQNGSNALASGNDSLKALCLLKPGITPPAGAKIVKVKDVFYYEKGPDEISRSLLSADILRYDIQRAMLNYQIDTDIQNRPKKIPVSGWRKQDWDMNNSGQAAHDLSLKEWIKLIAVSGSVLTTGRQHYQRRLEDVVLNEANVPFISADTHNKTTRAMGINIGESATVIHPDVIRELAEKSMRSYSDLRDEFNRMTAQELVVMNVILQGLTGKFYGASNVIGRGEALTYKTVLQAHIVTGDEHYAREAIEDDAGKVSAALWSTIMNPHLPPEVRRAAVDKLVVTDDRMIERMSALFTNSRAVGA